MNSHTRGRYNDATSRGRARRRDGRQFACRGRRPLKRSGRRGELDIGQTARRADSVCGANTAVEIREQAVEPNVDCIRREATEESDMWRRIHSCMAAGLSGRNPRVGGKEGA
ncbi:Hypothetical protein CINCED_3A015436 [Cinara cedri]|uniref:Uncharacterized protein n=1 Tax=Cinara cedri TaxID=506608 RepID=A0A5E4NMV8_9HEMI|nr:Hypothetical protein CINCED_3A015436 [Cinara cedri]